MNCSKCKKPMMIGEVSTGKVVYYCFLCQITVPHGETPTEEPKEAVRPTSWHTTGTPLMAAGRFQGRRAGESKYGNVKTVVDGITFDSRKEADYYRELKLREAAGEISCLALQRSYVLCANDVKICTYKADFVYLETMPAGPPRQVVVDVKGVKTPVYKLKKKMMLAIYGIDITEV